VPYQSDFYVLNTCFNQETFGTSYTYFKVDYGLSLIRGVVAGAIIVGRIDDQILHRWERITIHDDLTAA